MAPRAVLLATSLLACGPDGPDIGSSETGGGTTTHEPTTGDPLDCGYLIGKTFESVDEHECGLTPEGPEPCRWTIAFTADTYEHQHFDVVETGTYTCENGEISGTNEFMNPRGGTIDAQSAALVWQDIAYRPA